MANTFVKQGHRVDYPNTSGSSIASSAVVVLVSGASGMIGIAEDTIPNNTTGSIEVDGVQQLTANATDTGVIGTACYWDATNLCITVTSTSNTYAGRLAAALSGTNTVAQVWLNRK